MDANKIKSLRIALKMSQIELARELGANHESTVSRLESGSRKPTGAQLILLRRLAESVAAAK